MAELNRLFRSRAGFLGNVTQKFNENADHVNREEIDLFSIAMSLLNLEDSYNKFKSAHFLYVKKATGIGDEKVESVQKGFEEVTQRLQSCRENFELLQRETENMQNKDFPTLNPEDPVHWRRQQQKGLS